MPQKRWVAEDIGLGGRSWEYVCPIKLQGVAMVNVCGNLNRQPLRRPTHSVGKLLVGLMVYKEHGSLSNFGRPPVQLEAVELPN